MIILENITNFLETFLIRTISLVLNTSLSFCKELFKFVLILVLIYYFTFWTFRLWHPNVEYDSKTLNARIEWPDGSWIKETPSLIEQLEIEAEFEVNKNKFIRLESEIVAKDSDEGAIPKIEDEAEFEVNKNKFTRFESEIVTKDNDEGTIPKIEEEQEFEANKKKFVRLKPPDIVAKDSDEGIIRKIEFISLVEHKLNATSRPTQTKKTSLGKKSKLRDKSIETDKKDKTDKKVKKAKTVLIDDAHDD